MKIEPRSCPTCGLEVSDLLRADGDLTAVYRNPLAVECEVTAIGDAGPGGAESVTDGRGRTRVTCDEGHEWWAIVSSGAPSHITPVRPSPGSAIGADGLPMIACWMSEELLERAAAALEAAAVAIDHLGAGGPGLDADFESDRFRELSAEVRKLLDAR